MPPNDGIAEPEKALSGIDQYYRTLIRNLCNQPWQCPLGWSAQGCTNRGTQSLSLHYHESHTRPCTMLAQTRANGEQQGWGASTQYDQWTQQRFRAGCVEPSGGAR
jgi:hypothetical protein